MAFAVNRMGTGVVPVQVFAAGNTQFNTATNTPSFGALATSNLAGDPNRYIIAIVSARDNAVDGVFTQDVTFGGVSGTQIAEHIQAGSSHTTITGIWYKQITAGTTVTMAASYTGYSATFNFHNCSLFEVTGISMTPVATATSNIGTASVTITPTAAARFVLLGACETSGTADTWVTSGGGTVADLAENGQLAHGWDSNPDAGSTVYNYTTFDHSHLAAAFQAGAPV